MAEIRMVNNVGGHKPDAMAWLKANRVEPL